MVNFRPVYGGPTGTFGVPETPFTSKSPFAQSLFSEFEGWRSPAAYIDPNRPMPLPGFHKGGNIQYASAGDVPLVPFNTANSFGRQQATQQGFLDPQTGQPTPFASNFQRRQQQGNIWAQLANPVGVKTIRKPDNINMFQMQRGL